MKIPVIHDDELGKAYGKCVADMMKCAGFLWRKLEASLNEEQLELLDLYTSAQVHLGQISEFYYFEKGFLAGKQAAPEETVERPWEYAEAVVRMLAIDLRDACLLPPPRPSEEGS